MGLSTGKYQVVRKLAAGGMAEVYQAKAIGPDGFEKEVCLKRVLPHLARDPEFIEMFKAEARLAAKLQHTNIVQIFDFGEEDGSYFIAMEYVAGHDLRRLLERARRMERWLTPGLAAYIAHEVARGLAYAHARSDGGRPLGIVHRDVSPHNILLSLSGEVKIADFGIAKAASRAGSTRTGVLKGKLAYMAPEQARGEKVDARTDIFALGLILYEMLTGVRPFQADTENETLARVLHIPIVPPTEHAPHLPEPLSRLTMRALARDPGARFADGEELARDLARFLFTLPPEEVAASALGRFVRDLATPTDEDEPGHTVLGTDSPYAATASAAHPAPVARPDEATLLKEDTVSSAATSFTRTGVREGHRRWSWRHAAMVGLLAAGVAGAAAGWWWSRERSAGPPGAAASPPLPQDLAAARPTAPKPRSQPMRAPVGEPSRGASGREAEPAPPRPTATTRAAAAPVKRKNTPRHRRGATRRRRPRRHAAATTVLRVTTSPSGAWVRVGGGPARRAPFTITQVTRGRPLSFLVRLDKHRPLSRSITPRRARENLRLVLTPLPGRLRITAIPWAEIFLDGKLVSDMPQAGVAVSAGWHRVRLRNTARKYDRTFSVRVPPDGTAKLVKEIEAP